MSLVDMTLSGGVFILLITVVRALALHRLPKRTFPVLWALAALRLLLPFALPLPVSPFVSVSRLAVVVKDPVPALAPGGALPSPAAPPVPSAAPALSTVLPLIWLLGMALTAAWFAAAYLRSRLRFRDSQPEDAPAVGRWLESQRLRRPLEVRRSALVDSPLTWGILRSVILLPEELDRTDEKLLTCILTHELVHIRHFDAAAKLLFAAALCVHWFNPLVWVMFVLANRDMELSCDEGVLRALGGGEKASYALTLIRMEETRSLGFSPYSHFNKLAIEERIEAIMKYKKSSLLAAALAAALVLGATAAFAAGPQPDAAHDGAALPGTASRMDDSTLTSYTDKDGKNYYSWDGGKTWEPLTDEEFRLLSPLADVEWWTAGEYAAWLENEKKELQAMLGEKGWTGGRGEFVWTQEIIDETIAMYEKILREIKEGKLYSKSVGGGTDSLLISGGLDNVFAREKDGTLTPVDRVEVATFVFDGSTPVGINTFTIDKTGIATDDWDVARAPRYTEEEWRQIISDIESGRIPSFQIPDDPNVTTRFVDYPDSSSGI